jgi:lipopolysaccharide export LptBFGC system permease protein LptF
MGSIGKSFALILILIMAVSSVIMVKTAFAQSIPAPSVPEFTVKFVDASYNVTPSSSINPYTGQNVTNEGYHVENRTIELIIKNQPFASYISNGQNISFYFNVREKGHYEENWTTIYTVDNYYTSESNTDYTTLTYLLDQNDPPFWNNIPSGGQVDFQVEAMIGYVSRTVGFASWYFAGQESGWSNTQTLTIPETSSSPNPTPTVPEFPAIALVILPLLLSMFAVAVILRHRKTAQLE